MAFQTGQSTSMIDLFQKLSLFATTGGAGPPGWTENFSDYSTNRRLFLSKSTLFISWNWDPATPANVGIYQATGFINGTTAPGNHTGDSGQGIVSNSNATLATGRFIPLDDDTNTYWFFEHDTYLHVVVQTSTSPITFAHFGMGILNPKFGDNWTGGEYCYGHKNTASVSASNNAIQSDATYLLDGLLSTSNLAFGASLKMSGIPNQGASIWGISFAGVADVGAGGDSAGTDRGGSARSRVYGGYRGNGLGRAVGRIGSSNAEGLVDMYQINAFAQTTASKLFFLGTMPDVRGINIQYFSGGDEVVIGGDTWVLFPSRIKGEFNSASTSKYQGIAYKKVTT